MCGGNIKTLTRRDKEDSDIEIQTKKEDEKLKIQEYIKSNSKSIHLIVILGITIIN